MTEQFDIFRLDSDGKESWVEPSKTLDDAKARIRELNAKQPGVFIILDQRSSEKIMIRAEG